MEGDCENPQRYEEIELNLGLSMNGRFGVDPTRVEKLRRSSSTAFSVAGDGSEGPARHSRGPEFETLAPPPLWRTRSLPTGAEEEEWRRRKELQSIRRMEARKKRMGKLRSSRVSRGEKEINGGVCKGVASGASGKKGSGEGVDGNFTFQRLPDNSILRRFESGNVMESSQGSIGPPRAGSSGSSDLIDGIKPKRTEEGSPSGHQNSQDQEPSTGRVSVGDAKVAPAKSPKNPMLDMPLVTTKDTGPNGRKVEGFLYGYKKGEEVRIVCVCHGTFLTPKEFVEHGGGGVVEHPLKHIVVNPFPLL